MFKRFLKLVPVLSASLFLLTVADASAQTTTAKPAAPAPAAARPWTVSFDGQHGELSGSQSDQGQYTFGVLKAINPRVKLFANVDQHDRFDELDTLLNAGGEFGFPRRRTLVKATYTEGFGAEMASQRGIDVQYSFQASRHVRPEFEVEYDRYIHDLHLAKYSVGLALLPSAKLQAQVQLLVSAASEDKGGTAGQFGLSYTFNERISIKAGAGYGHEHFLARAAEEVRRELTALGLSGQINFSLAHHNTVYAGWDFADRKTAYKTNTLKFGWSRSF